MKHGECAGGSRLLRAALARAGRFAALPVLFAVSAFLAGDGCNAKTGRAAESTGQFAGSASCRECHERFYNLWATSFHGLAMQPFADVLARKALIPQTRPIKVGGEYSYYAVLHDNTGWVVEKGPDGESKMPIVHAMGGKNVYYFLTPLERGRLQTLPLAYDVNRKTWLDTAASGVRHVPGQADDRPLHWKDPEYTFNTSCYSCHVSLLDTNYDLESDTYRTTWEEPGINCETCHGPAEKHVALFRQAKEGSAPEDMGIVTVSQSRGFSAHQTSSACSGCHAKMSPVSTGYKPPDSFFDHFDLTAFEHPDFYPDGRDLGENYTYSLWRMNPCAKAGQLDCMHCHTSSGRYRFKEDAVANNACLPCHAERVASAPLHTHHEADSAGNRCIACHMPMTEFARMHRSDHSMRPPMPAATLAFESPNACNMCHADQDAKWADETVREWRDRDYQADTLHWGGLVKAARAGEWARLAEMLEYLKRKDHEEMVAVSLIRLLAGCSYGRKWTAIIEALEDPSPLVRSSAATALSGYLTPEAVAALLAATKDESRLVRVRAAATLAPAPREAVSNEGWAALSRAVDEYLTVTLARPDDPLSHYNRGNFLMARRDLQGAVSSFETAISLRPDLLPPHVNLALALNALGRNAEAESSLRRALAINPDNLAANLNLGLLLGEMGRRQESVAAFRHTLKVDPNSATAAYNLAVLVAEDDLEEAVERCRHAAQLRPDDARFAYTLAFYQAQSQKLEDAVFTLEKLLIRRPDHGDSILLLGALYENQDKTEQASALYERSLGQERIPPRQKAVIEHKLHVLSGH